MVSKKLGGKTRSGSKARTSKAGSSESQLPEASGFTEVLIQTLRDPIVVLQENMVVEAANNAFLSTFGYARAQVIDQSIFKVDGGRWDFPEIRLLEEMLGSDGEGLVNVEVRRAFSATGDRILCLNSRTYRLYGRRRALLCIEDISVQKRAEEARNEALRQLVNYDDKERHRLALELHDETGQHITAFMLGLARLKQSYATSPESSSLIEILKERADELAQNLHGISLQLRPIALDEHGLERALHNLTEDVALKHDLDVDYQGTGLTVRLPGHIESVLYRVTQEALTNAVRHGNPSRVSVVLTRRGRDVSLVLEDNGHGFDVDKALSAGSKGHLGLRGMRERVMLAGGTFTVESEAGAGSTIFVRIPLSPGKEEIDE